MYETKFKNRIIEIFYDHDNARLKRITVGYRTKFASPIQRQAVPFTKIF